MVVRDGLRRLRLARAARLAAAGGAAWLALAVVLFGGGGTEVERYYFLGRVDDAYGIALTVNALVIAWLIARTDHRDDFPLLRNSRWLPAMRFAAARATAAVLWLLGLAVAGAAFVQLAWAVRGGADPAGQALHAAVLAANVLPLLLAGLWLGTLVGPLAGQAVALLVLAYTGDADLDYARAGLQRIPSGAVARFVQAEHWVLPRILVDPLKLVLLRNESLLIRQLPGDQGPVLWDDSVVLVSSAGDVVFFALYALALVALYGVAVRRRMRWIQSREPLLAFPPGIGQA